MSVPLPMAALARLAAVALDAALAPRPASLGLLMSDDRELAALNAEHMGKRGPTDVLSFPLLPAEAFGRDGPVAAASADFTLPPGRRPHLGDIVVSVERAAAQAHEGRGGQTGDVRWSVAEEVALLVVHGTLHLCGWDHAEAADEADMRAMERRILAAAGPTLPGRTRAAGR
ncbi:MAG TPA: rRNA maturation RNase YbeY [Candidatus Limnocylindrales bacterium]|nr:rRNA maturation RNase YbeY [Candidatus Limnocylindrales bacterium]